MGIVLALTVLFPLVGAISVLAAGRWAPHWIRHVALAAALVTMLLAIGLVITPPGLHAVRWPWLENPDISFAFGVDGISLWLVELTALLMITSVLVSWDSITKHQTAYYALLLTLETGMLGVFTAMDIILFYIFFEFTLVPLFFIIGLWGGPERRAAARKFFIYTLAGSVLTFLGLIYLVIANTDPVVGSGVLTFSIPELIETLHLPPGTQYWVFLALFAGFAIKVPVFPFHTWLPLAHVEAPTAGSVILAGILLKIGSYGFVRFSLPILPDASLAFVPLIAGLAVLGVLYGALAALAQQDMKRLVAYSSISHMGFCMLGLFALNTVGLSGGILQMVAHGLATGALFALVGMIYDRYHRREIDSFSGLARRMPILTFFFVLMALSSLGLPGLAGFVAEVMALLGMFREHPGYAVLAAIGIILGAWYLLALVQRCFFGPLWEPHTSKASNNVTDLRPREIAALAPLAVLVVWIGVYPQFFLNRMEPDVNAIIHRIELTAQHRAVSGTSGFAESRQSARKPAVAHFQQSESQP